MAVGRTKDTARTTTDRLPAGSYNLALADRRIAVRRATRGTERQPLAMDSAGAAQLRLLHLSSADARSVALPREAGERQDGQSAPGHLQAQAGQEHDGQRDAPAVGAVRRDEAGLHRVGTSAVAMVTVRHEKQAKPLVGPIRALVSPRRLPP